MTVYSSSNAKEARELGLIPEEHERVTRYDLSAMSGGAPFRHDSGEDDATGILNRTFITFGTGWKPVDSPTKAALFTSLICERVFQYTNGRGQPQYDFPWRLGWVADVDSEEFLRGGRLSDRLSAATDHRHVLWVTLPKDSAPAAQGWAAAAVHIESPMTFQGSDGRYYVSLKDSIIGHYRMYRYVQEAADEFELAKAAVEYRVSLTGHDGMVPEDDRPRDSDRVDLRPEVEVIW